MKVRRIRLGGFRNLESAELQPGPGLNGFWGANAQGKTNLLEAIFATLRGKSFRPYAGREDWPAFGQSTFHVQLELEDARGFERQVSLACEAGKIAFFLNEKKVRAATVREQVPVVAFSPDDHALIRGGPEGRRNFLDEVFGDISPAYAEAVSRYEKTLKSRNQVLRRAKDFPFAGIPAELLAEWKAWTGLLAESAAVVAQGRRDLWSIFEPQFLTIASSLMGPEGDQLSLSFRSDVDESIVLRAGGIPPSMGGTLRPRDFELIFEESKVVDHATGWTHRGPHRDDFAILLSSRGDEARAKASQGQARVLALALKWTHAEWIRQQRAQLPIFLIDDLSSELDARRRERLLHHIQQLSGQLFVTGTDPSLVESGIDSEAIYEYTHYDVIRGVINPQKRAKTVELLNV